MGGRAHRDMPAALANSTGDDLYRVLGKGLAGILTCARCTTTVQVDEMQAGKFVREGWPECHGETMNLVQRRVRRPPRKERAA